MTNRRPTIKALATGALLGLAATAGLLVLATDQAQPAPKPAPTATPALSADLEGETWWTTTDCPEGVEVPCLDPTVDPALVPAEVAAQLGQLVDAEWVCLDQVAQPRPDRGVYATDAQLAQCRQYAYAVVQPTA